jgi:hypothetical protein
MPSFVFGHPLMLWALPVAALPVLIHLFYRRRARPLPFAAIHFVLKSERRTARRLRIRRIVLFTMRTLLLLALPLALAMPQAKRRDEVAAAPRGPAATAFILDGSMSMTYRKDGRSVFERARELLSGALASTSAEDPVTFLACTANALPPRAPSFDRGEVRRQIDAMTPTFGAADLTKCIGIAARALGDSPLRGKRIFVATDLTAAAFHLDVPAPVIRTPEGDVRPEVVLLDAVGGPMPNRAIVDLRAEPATALGHRAYQFSFTVRNYSPDPVKDLTAVLRVGNEVVAKGFLDLPSGGTAQKTLSYQFPSGGIYEGKVEIAADDLSADDVRPFVVRVPREVRALVINGSPSPVRFRDEAFFVEAALTAPGSPVAPVFRDTETANDDVFSKYDVVFLLNVRDLPKPRVHELAEFLENGGGLFVSLGDQIDSDRYEDGIGTLLPRKLRLVKTAAERGTENAAKSAAHFAKVDFNHPVLSIFSGEARTSFVTSRTFRYFLLEPGSDAMRVIAAYDDGAPALVEGTRGRGRVIVYTSTVDRDWSDWPIQPSFLPTLQRAASYLAGALDEREAKSVAVGDPMPIEPPPGVEIVGVVGPDGKEQPIRHGEKGPYVGSTDLPGIYRVKGHTAKERDRVIEELGFSVQVDPRESDTTRLEERELIAYFGEGTRTDAGTGRGGHEEHLPAWTALLVTAVAAFIVEGLLLRR